MTVVIPVWGTYAGGFLDRAIASVAAQGVGSVFILVVDNWNPERIEVTAPGCAVVRTPARLTLGQARNFGLAAVDTEFVLFLDADDELVPGVVARMASVLKAEQSAVAVAPQLVDRRTGRRYHWPGPGSFWASERLPSLFRLMEALRPSFPVNAALMRASVAQLSPGYGQSPEAAEDWVLGVSLVVRGRVRLLRIPGLVYQARSDGRWARQTRWRAQARHRKEIRRRLYEDPALRTSARMLVPLLAVAHEVDVLRTVRWFVRGPGKRAS